MKHGDLVFDVGMFRGEDTEQYLELGFRVLAVEANPDLVRAMEARFANAIDAGRLTIIAAAIAEEPGKIEFSVSDDHVGGSTLDGSFIARNRDLFGIGYRTIEVPAVRFADLLAEHGVPHFMKVDIEGSDMLCVRALREVSERPDYLSIESAVTAPGASMERVFDELAELWTLGYRGFKLIDQTRLGHLASADASGPFGEQTPGRWAPIGPTLARAATIRLQYDVAGCGGRWAQTIPGRAVAKFRIDVLKRPQGWYDLHATLGA